MKLTIFTKPVCSSNCFDETPLLRDNLLSEFLTEAQKYKARKNLGVAEPEDINPNYIIVDTLTERNKNKDVKPGLLCYVINDATGNHLYIYHYNEWVVLSDIIFNSK